MQTITLEQPGRFTFGQTEPPNGLAADEALVCVRRVGICGTDIHAFGGRQPFFTYPRILGHELGVEIAEIGSNDAGLSVGDRCAVEPYMSCGVCVACRRGKTNCCVSLKVLGVHTDGGMREVIKVPIANLHRSEKLSLDQLALVETLGIGAHAVDRANLEPGEYVLIIGAGPIGLSVIQFATLTGAKVIVLDVNAKRLAFCRERFDVAATIPASDDALSEITAATGGDLPTAVFDATGSPESMIKAFQFVSHGGRLVLVGLVQADVTFHDPDFHRRETTLLATRNSTGADFRRIIALMEAGRIDTTPWITHRAPFAQMIDCFPSWLQPESGVIKAMVEIE